MSPKTRALIVTERMIVIRAATLADLEAIMSVLVEIACEIPLDLDLRVPGNVMRLRESFESDFFAQAGGPSLVAIGENEAVVGFQLAKRRRWFDEDHIHLVYGGVTAAARGHKIFRKLIEAEKKNGLPLYAVVKPDNKSDMVRRLECYHFRRDEGCPSINEFAYWWHPSDASGVL
jgi:hypothetical protein